MEVRANLRVHGLSIIVNVNQSTAGGKQIAVSPMRADEDWNLRFTNVFDPGNPFSVLRALVGLLTGFSLLSATTETVVAACDHGKSSAVATSDARQHTDPHHGAPASEDTHQACNSATDCCRAMPSCGGGSLISERSFAVPDFPASATFGALVPANPPTRLTAPEPPPPRA